MIIQEKADKSFSGKLLPATALLRYFVVTPAADR